MPGSTNSTTLLLEADDVGGNSTELLNSTSTIIKLTKSSITPITQTMATKTTMPTSTVPSPLTTTALPGEDGSYFTFLFCSILFIVGTALIAKIIYSNRKKYRSMNPPWRLSASRYSGNVPAGFALTRDSFASRGRGSEPFGSAHYTAVPPSTNARLASQDAFVGNPNAQLEWERQFFENDATQTNDSSRLEFRH